MPSFCHAVFSPISCVKSSPFRCGCTCPLGRAEGSAFGNESKNRIKSSKVRSKSEDSATCSLHMHSLLSTRERTRKKESIRKEERESAEKAKRLFLFFPSSFIFFLSFLFFSFWLFKKLLCNTHGFAFQRVFTMASKLLLSPSPKFKPRMTFTIGSTTSSRQASRLSTEGLKNAAKARFCRGPLCPREVKPLQEKYSQTGCT